jgi:hypothetical protein
VTELWFENGIAMGVLPRLGARRPRVHLARAAEIVEHGYSGVTEAAAALVQR